MMLSHSAIHRPAPLLLALSVLSLFAWLVASPGCGGPTVCRNNADCPDNTMPYCVLAQCKATPGNEITTEITSTESTQPEPPPTEPIKPEPPPTESDTSEPPAPDVTTNEPPRTETRPEPSPEPPTNDAGNTPEKGTCQPGQFRECYTALPNTKDKGPCTSGTQVCQPNQQWSACFKEVTPQPEICDRIDNDCNGKIDDNTTETGNPCQDQSRKGECQKGTYTACTNGNLICTSRTQPSTEICDDGKDNDCDGTIDSGPKCPCKKGETRPCGSDVGECTKGTQACDKKSQWGSCLGSTQPSTERCDGKDNDCDGLVDEDFPTLNRPCTAGKGACQNTGRIVCTTSQTSAACNAKPGAPQAETCDGKDNDCNGQVDDNIPGVGSTCTVGTGSCQQTGRTQCDANAKTILCSAKPGAPQAEICDGKDNNCDGQIDNASNGGPLKGSCYTGPNATQGIGTCKAGTQTCSGGKWSACQGQTLPAAVDGCSNEDANCNGKPNEGCACTNGATQPCGSSIGTCKAGKQTCSSGQWGTCVGQTGPKTEVCDGLDNNCNGQVDDGLGGSSCTEGQGECLRTGTMVCDAASKQLVCSAKAGTPQAETCNNKDDNCNGQVDENNPGGNKACTTGAQGICGTGTTRCANGTLLCDQTFVPQQLIEQCRNNQDDDCDGLVDEICGPLHSYALVDKQGQFKATGTRTHQRGFSAVKRLGNGHYELTPSGTDKCDKLPLFLTPNGLYARAMAYTCAANGNYIIKSGREHKGSIPPGTPENTDFHAVVPEKSETFAIVQPGCRRSQTCQLSAKNGSIVIRGASTLLGSGAYEIVSPLCSESYRPVFATIMSNDPEAFAATFRTQGKCYVFLRELDGSRTTTPGFAVWLPDSKKNAFATIRPISSGTTPNIHLQNNFGDQQATWSANSLSHPANECPGSNSACQRTLVYFPSWANPSAIVLGLREDRAGGTAFTQLSTGAPQKSLLFTTTNTPIGRVSDVLFNVLFVQ